MTQKEISKLYHFTALTKQEIAELAGITPSAVAAIAQRITAHDIMTGAKIQEPESYKYVCNGIEYNTIQEASDALGVSTAGVHRVVVGDIPNIKGFVIKKVVC
jgi:hypothetical protein